MNNSPLYLVIQQLIASGRITGLTPALALDGETFLHPDDNINEPTEAALWNADGTSVILSEFGGQMIKGVEDLRNEALAHDSAIIRDIGAGLPQYFVRLNAQIPFTPFQEFQARENHTNHYMVRAMIGMPLKTICSFSRWSPRHFVKGTKTPEWRYAVEQSEVDFAKGGSNPIETVANHRICVQAWTVHDIIEWAKNWIDSEYKARTSKPGIDFSPMREI